MNVENFVVISKLALHEGFAMTCSSIVHLQECQDLGTNILPLYEGHPTIL